MSQVVGFDGDRKLDIATDVGQSAGGIVHYELHLNLGAGKEQSIEIVGPPGGLNTEVRDMTGDNVRNDLLLTPSLLCWPPTVLVNDGHDHFAVAISGVTPESISSREELASTPIEPQGTAGLISPGFQTGGLASAREIAPPRLQEPLSLCSGEGFAASPENSSKSGRAPPLVVSLV